jgi:sterol desaturase/sphingolipid hydroxylase (fatty acid hydroxylase superfamily)
MDLLFRLIEPLQSWLFQGLVLPALYRLGFMSHADSAYDATGVFTLAMAEIALIYIVVRPLEAWRPVEDWADRRALRVDVLYTFLYRSGLLPLAFFLMLDPLLTPAEKALRAAGYLPPNLEELVPWLATRPLAAFLAYALLIDLAEYWRHRLQHRFDWWWALHAVHHSQRQLSFWADDRNHVLDGLIQSLWLVAVAHLIGVPGGQFVFLVLLMRFVESFSHANLRLGFGALGARLLVGPRYHRLHHGIGTGHEGPARGRNFAALFPLWDMVFGTADFGRDYPPTGIRDQLTGADYGRGFLAQQVKGVRRLARALAPASRSSA